MKTQKEKVAELNRKQKAYAQTMQAIRDKCEEIARYTLDQPATAETWADVDTNIHIEFELDQILKFIRNEDH